MDLQLTGKRAFVTGASSGIGVEIAKLLAREGAIVVVSGRDADRTAETARQIELAGGKAVVAVGDIATEDGADTLADIATKALGGVDILVNNAGASSSVEVRSWDQIPVSDYLLTYNLNVAGGLRLIHRFVPGMVAQAWGRVINISSVIGRHAMGMMHDYAASKIAMEAISLNLSMNLAPQGVTVNTVVPGLIMTPVTHSYVTHLAQEHGWPVDEAQRQSRYIAEYAPQPVPRLGNPGEIASAVAFLASPLSDYTTGAVLRVDGGATRGL